MEPHPATPGSPPTDCSERPTQHGGRLRAEKRNLLLWMLPSAAGGGAASGSMLVDAGSQDLTWIIPQIIVLVLAILWASRDAAERGFRLTRGWLWGMALLFLVTFPLYLLATRGARGLITIGLTICYGVLLGVVFVLAESAFAVITRPI